MGSVASLGIEKMELDWGKNNYFSDHSSLFQNGDLKEAPYYYVDDDGKPITITKRAYSKKLASVKKRLDLLGYSIKGVECTFNQQLNYVNRLYDVALPFCFNDYYKVIRSIDIKNIDMASGEYLYEHDLGEYARKCVLNEISELKELTDEDNYIFSEFLENIIPYITLRIIAENDDNLDLNVIWRVADVIDNGWVSEEEVKPCLSDYEKILIVTEGSSDTDIIRKSIHILHDDVADFFYFIDMESNYPFTGTGNLRNFIKGLSKINILNKVLVVLDNDTVGVETFNELKGLKLPKNLHITTLPSHGSFERFKCYGPHGLSYENINGRAVAIESFLDFDSVNEETFVRWTSYNKKMKQYQGVIEPKDKLIRAFHNSIKKDYNFQKISFLLDYILDSWINR